MADPKPGVPEQDQLIKAAKHQLFEEEVVTSSGPRKTFREYLRETPARPLSMGVKALLWGAGAVVVLLLILALLSSGQSSHAKRPAPAAPTPAVP
ncbi:MAG: hypothetical protein IRY99_21940 [Isosphaeraceae bacterium]|nr:hypothetical protein [Isosphaeraceae bacterium]